MSKGQRKQLERVNQRLHVLVCNSAGENGAGMVMHGGGGGNYLTLAEARTLHGALDTFLAMDFPLHAAEHAAEVWERVNR